MIGHLDSLLATISISVSMAFSTPDRLCLALLTEMISGNYSAGDRFLSHRIIRRHWRVADITVMRTITMLRKYRILKTVERSGNYLSANFRHLALLAIADYHAKKAVSPLPLRLHDWRKSILARETLPTRTDTIAIVLIAPIDIYIDPKEGHAAGYTCAATAQAIEAIQRSSRHAGISTNIYHCNGSTESKAACLRLIKSSHCLGAIVICRILSYPLEPFCRALERMMLPVAAIFSNEKHALGIVTVNFNNIGGGYNAAKTLFDKGHRHLATITTAQRDNNDINSNDRVHGFALFHKEVKRCHVHNYIINKNKAKQNRLIKNLIKNKVTAIFCVGIAPTRHLVEALNRHSLSVPADFSLISCSAIHDLKSLALPSLDILHLDFGKLGECAFNALLLMLDGKTPQRHIVFTPSVTTSGSVVRPRKSTFSAL